MEGFTAPAWGEHPDYDVQVSPTANYTIAEITWNSYISEDFHVLESDEYFDNEEAKYYLFVLVSPKEGYVFAEEPAVYFDGDNTVFSYGTTSGNNYRIYTIDYQVTDPTVGIEEQTANSVAIWPNPATDVLYLDIMDGETISIFDMTGRMVMQQRYEGKVDVSDLASGIYTVKAEYFTIRFVKGK